MCSGKDIWYKGRTIGISGISVNFSQFQTFLCAHRAIMFYKANKRKWMWRYRRHAVYTIAASYGLDSDIACFIIDMCELGQFGSTPRRFALADALVPRRYACGGIFLCGCPVIRRQLTYHFYWREVGSGDSDDPEYTDNGRCLRKGGRIAGLTYKPYRLAHVAYSVLAAHQSPCQRLFPGGDGDKYEQVVQCESGYIALVSDK